MRREGQRLSPPFFRRFFKRRCQGWPGLRACISPPPLVWRNSVIEAAFFPSPFFFFPSPSAVYNSLQNSCAPSLFSLGRRKMVKKALPFSPSCSQIRYLGSLLRVALPYPFFFSHERRSTRSFPLSPQQRKKGSYALLSSLSSSVYGDVIAKVGSFPPLLFWANCSKSNRTEGRGFVLASMFTS